MPARESTARNFLVAGAVAVACSLLVSLTAVGLRARRERGQDLERMRAILAVAGLYDPAVPVAYAFRHVEARVVDLDTGRYVPEESLDPTAQTVLAPRDDVAGIGKRERYVRVYLVRDATGVRQVVLPVRGQGWSELRGFLALDRDLTTVRGFAIHAHAETAGMGAEVDNPKWKARWPGKRLYDDEGRLRLNVVADGRRVSPYEVDGITGATLTTEGLQGMIRFWFGDLGYRRYLERLAKEGVDHG